MITVVVSVYRPTTKFLDVLISSILKTQLVKECIFVVTDWHGQYEGVFPESEIIRNNIVFKTVYLPERFRELFEPVGYDPLNRTSVAHACGLDYGTSLASQEYIMFLDHDVFFYLPVDAIFYSLIQKYSLDVIGISHFSPTAIFYHFFPSVICMMLKKASLPDESFLEEMREVSPHISNLFSPPGNDFALKVENHLGSVPGSGKIYDTGSLLYFWAMKKNWRWLSFQTIDALNYSLCYNRGNIKEEVNLKNQKFLYHESHKNYEELRRIAKENP